MMGVVFGYFLQVVSQPLALFGADFKSGLHAVVESRHGVHAFLRRHAARGPEVFLVDAHQHHEVHAFVVEGIGRLAEVILPVLAHIQEPVMLAHHHADGGFQTL